MLGITFKENCPDVRNTKIVDVIHALRDYGIQVSIFDPLANPEEVLHEYGLVCHTEIDLDPQSLRPERSKPVIARVTKQTSSIPQKYDAIVLGVAHKEFLKMDLTPLKKKML